MPRLICLDTYYPPFLETLTIDQSARYESELQKVLARAFGTGDFVTRNLRTLGWTAEDAILNCEPLQRLWAREKTSNPFGNLTAIGLEQIEAFNPDVVFMQDLSFFSITQLQELRKRYLLAAQHSCPWAGDERVSQFHMIATSFPHYIPRIEALGVRAVFNPLAFDESVLNGDTSTFRALGYGPVERQHDCVFIGGVGNPSHWKYGMEVLETVAREIPTFKWWGYGVETLPTDSILRQKYQGSAFGLDMYFILLQSKIALCRHGEVAEGYTNAMRVYESTGCGALTLTEESKNVWDLFQSNEIQTYLTPSHAVEKIRYYLSNDSERAAIAANGQLRTLKDHTYAKRMQVISDTLKEMLVAA